MIVKVSEKENGQVIETQVSLQCKPIYPGLIKKLIYSSVMFLCAKVENIAS